MSEQETIKGKIREVFIGDKDSMEEFAKELCKRNEYFYSEEYFESYLECLQEEGYKDYIISDNSIYEVIERTAFEYDGIFEASKNDDDTISFVLSYYNGGCSFDEAIEKALENMENK